MDNPQFLALIHHLGDDMGYITRRMEQEVAKNVGHLKQTGDVKRFCRKLAAMLLNFRMYATMYAHTLEERILTYQLEDELPDVLVSLHELTQKKEKMCVQCDQKSEKVDGTTQTELEQSELKLTSSDSEEQVSTQSVSSQGTVPYDHGLKLITGQEVSAENPPNYSRTSSSESLHSILSQETVLNGCNDSNVTTTDCGPVNCSQPTEETTQESQIFNIETNDSVDLEIKQTINHLLDEVCTALSKTEEEVDHLLEELSNAISRPSQMEKVDFLKTLEVSPNCEKPVEKKLSEEDRLALLKVIKQFCVKKYRGRRSRKIVDETESSSDEMPVQKPRRKKKKQSTEREGDGAVIQERHTSPAPKGDESEDSIFASLEPPVGVPERRKSMPLPDSPSEDTESQVVLPFKRDVVKPLPSSHSELEEDCSVLQKKGSKRLRPSSESDLESLKESQIKRPRLLSESSGSQFNSQFNLDSTGRDELLSLLNKTPPPVKKALAALTSEVNDSDVEFVSMEPPKVQFNLNSSERDDLLDLLNKEESTLLRKDSVNNNNEIEEDSESSYQLNDKDRDELVELLIQSALERQNDLSNNRETLIELIKEFEGSLANEVLPGSEVPTTGSFAGSLESESPLLDILREETVEEELPARGRPKVHNKETWDAFEALLDTDDDFLSSSSSSELSESDLSLSLRGLNRKVQPVLTQEIKTELGLDKELFVDVEQADFSHFSEFNSGHTIRKPRRSSSTSSLLSNTDLDSLGCDMSDTPPPPSVDEKPSRLAASLLDNITNSSDEDDWSEGGASSSTSQSDKSSTGKNKKKVELDSSDEEDFVGVRKSVPTWKRNPLLNMDVSNSESEDSEPTEKRERKKKSFNLDAESDDSDIQIVNKSPLKTFQVDDDSDDSDFEIVSVYPKEKTPQNVITLSDEEVGKSSKGRRNIRALMEEEDLSEATQTAHNEERERIKRLQEKDKAMEVFSQSLSFASQFSEDDCHPLILDVKDTNQIKVHPKIAIKLKPHQRDGIQFMWDSCYESVKQLQAGYKGSGCILAHCMGLGKTLQALALIQTLFANPITKTKHVLVVCPLSTVSNWKNEYKLAFKGLKESGVKFYSIEDKRAANMRFSIVNKWRRSGGMLVMGYECFGLMVNEDKLEKWADAGVFDKESILEALIDPGPDLVICDEGHLLRNKQSQRTLALNKVSTRRRIILTGTPLQNNLLEYYYMVNFVKPNLLGTEKEYKTNFVNPIVNGQFEDSTAEDIMFMKKRTHVLHKILNRTVQRVEDTELKQYLPKLIDQAVFVKLSDLQVELYNTYLDSTNSRPVIYTKSGTINRKNFLADVQILRYICAHPNVITTAEKNGKSRIREQDVIGDVEDDLDGKMITKGGWYKNLLSADRAQHLSAGSKLLLTLGIVEEAAANGDKTLIFSQSHAEMDNLEKFLVETLQYKNKRDYFRMDGTISPEVRTHMCDRFNNPEERDIKVFIMSTKVGGLGLNLTAANRVVIMSVSWNPSYDTQSVFRSFRFGQNKPVYVYRLIAMDTMEEKMYQRSVTKLAIAHRVVDKHQITRHYNSADIQEYYSVRPTADKTRPVPNLPEDCILAKLIQKHQVLFKWHEHQALLTNRPEEDLDEQQKNAAWEEFNKKTDPALTILGPTIFNPQNQSNRVFNPAARVNTQMILRARNQRLNLHQLYEGAVKRAGEFPRPGPSRLSNVSLRNKTAVNMAPNRKMVVQTGRVRASVRLNAPIVIPSSSGTDATSDTNLEEVNSILAESLQHPEEAALTTLVIHDSSDDEDVAAHPDHTYSLPQPSLTPLKFLGPPRYLLVRKSACASLEQRTTSAEDFKPIVIKRLNRPRPPTNQVAGPALTIIRPAGLSINDDRKKTIQAFLDTQIAKTQKAVKEEQKRQIQPTLNTDKLVLQKVTPLTLRQNNPIGPKGVVIKATPTKGKDMPIPVNRQSPMQHQMRSSLEQLHLLQERSYLSKSGDGVTLKAVKDLTNFTSQNVGETNQNVINQSEVSQKKPFKSEARIISIKKPSETHSRDKSASTVSQGQLSTSDHKSGNAANHIPYMAVDMSKPVMLVGVGNNAPSRVQVKPLNILRYAPTHSNVDNAPPSRLKQAKIDSNQDKSKVAKLSGHSVPKVVKVGHPPENSVTLKHAHSNNLINSRKSSTSHANLKAVKRVKVLNPDNLKVGHALHPHLNQVKVSSNKSRRKVDNISGHTPIKGNTAPNYDAVKVGHAPENSVTLKHAHSNHNNSFNSRKSSIEPKTSHANLKAVKRVKVLNPDNLKVGHAPENSMTLKHAHSNHNHTFNSSNISTDSKTSHAHFKAIRRVKVQGSDNLKPLDLSKHASHRDNTNDTSLKKVKIVSQKSVSGRGNDTFKTTKLDHSHLLSTKPNHALNLQPRTNNVNVKQKVTDWIADTLKYMNSANNSSIAKQNGGSPKAISTDRSSGTSTNPNGRFVKRLVNAPVNPSGLSKIQWKQKDSPLNPTNLKKKTQPGRDKENYNFPPSDVVQSLQKKGVSVSRVDSSSR